MISFCVLQTNQRSGPRRVIELCLDSRHTNSLLKQAGGKQDARGVAAFSIDIYNEYTIKNLASSLELVDAPDETKTFNVYGRSLKETGNTYMALIYYFDASNWRAFVRQNDLQLLDFVINTFIHHLQTRIPRNKLIPMRVLKNLQNTVDLLCSLNTAQSLDSAALVRWDTKCHEYTSWITNCTQNKTPVVTKAFNQRSSFYAPPKNSPSPSPQRSSPQRGSPKRGSLRRGSPHRESLGDYDSPSTRGTPNRGGRRYGFSQHSDSPSANDMDYRISQRSPPRYAQSMLVPNFNEPARGDRQRRNDKVNDRNERGDRRARGDRNRGDRNRSRNDRNRGDRNRNRNDRRHHDRGDRNRNNRNNRNDRKDRNDRNDRGDRNRGSNSQDWRSINRNDDDNNNGRNGRRTRAKSMSDDVNSPSYVQSAPPAGFKWARKSENDVHRQKENNQPQWRVKQQSISSQGNEYKEEENHEGMSANDRQLISGLPAKYAHKLAQITRELAQFQKLRTELNVNDDDGVDREQREMISDRDEVARDERGGPHDGNERYKHIPYGIMQLTQNSNCSSSDRSIQQSPGGSGGSGGSGGFVPAVSMSKQNTIDANLAESSPVADDEIPPGEHLKLMDMMSNSTVVIHDELKEMESNEFANKQSVDVFQRQNRRRSTVAGVLGMDSISSNLPISPPKSALSQHDRHKSHSEILMDFQSEYQKAQSVQKQLINHLKALLAEVESDALPTFDDEEEESHSDIQLSASPAPRPHQLTQSTLDQYEMQRIGEQLKQQQLACTTWLQLPASRMAQNGISDGVALMKSLFDQFARTDIPQNEHRTLYRKVYSRIIKHLPYNQTALAPLLSPSSSSSDMSHMTNMSGTGNDPVGASVAAANSFNSLSFSNRMNGLNGVRASKQLSVVTPYNTPNLSRETSMNTDSRPNSNPNTPMMLTPNGQNLNVPAPANAPWSLMGTATRTRSASAPTAPTRSPRVQVNPLAIDEDTEDTPERGVHGVTGINGKSGTGGIIREKHKGPRHRRQRSKFDEIMDENTSLQQQYQRMMGTIGDAAVFQQMFKSILVEVANANNSDNDESNLNAVEREEREKRRESLRITDTKTDFVQDIMRLEGDLEIDDKFWKDLSWDFDPVAFSEHSKVKGNCVVLLGWHLIKMNHYHAEFHVTPSKLIHFLYQIQEAYQGNPYHNKIHAADVMNNMYWFMDNCPSIKRHLTAFDRFICIMAAALHDVDHDGKSNGFHKKTASKLALRYNDKSIQENHHISYAFKLIASDSKYDWIHDLGDEQMIETTRTYLIRLILGTDISVHKKHVQQIETLRSVMSDPKMVLGDDQKLDLLEVVLHAADIANACKPKKLSIDWAQRVVEEFRMEGDAEKELFGKLSMDLFSRDNPLEKSQNGWIQFVMKPYFEPLNQLMNGDLDGLMQHLSDNLSAWSEYRESTPERIGNVNGPANGSYDGDIGDDEKVNVKEARSKPQVQFKRTKTPKRASSFEDIMDENQSLQHQYQRMMGTIGDPAEFERRFKELLNEVATTTYVTSSDEDQDAKDENHRLNVAKAEQARLRRESLRIMETKRNFVDEIVKLEGDLEIDDKFWKDLSWDFDPVAFSEHSKVKGNCVVLLGWHLIKMNHYHTEFHVAPSKLIHFLYQIQEAYQGNPYHNKIHAADVMNNMYWFMDNCPSIKRHLTAFDRFICIMAAAVHDVDHSGKSNAFHKRTASKLALRYNDKSIQENHHISYAFKLIASDSKYDWIHDLGDEQMIETTRTYLIRLILGTDMSVHKKHVQQIETLRSVMSDPKMVLGDDQKLDLLEVVLHAADIANACKPSKLSIDWAQRVVEEFRMEGDEQKRLYGKVSDTLYSRDHPLEKGQKGWIQFVMKPYFDPLNQLLGGDLDHMMNHLDDNLSQWDQYQEFAVKEANGNCSNDDDDDEKAAI